MAKKEDARITRTKNELRKGLLSLLRGKPFEKITVAEICQTSKINKMTFYKHYDDKYDLLDDCARTTIEEVIGQVRLAHGKIERIEDFPDCFATFVVMAYDKVLEVKEVLLSLADAEANFGGQVVRNALEQSLEKTMTKLLERLQIHYHVGYVTAFFVGGFASVAMRIVHEGRFDRDYCFRSAKDVCDSFIRAKRKQAE